MIAANVGYGVAITGTAHDNTVNASAIGQVGLAQVKGNAAAACSLAPARPGRLAADPDPAFLTTIAGNLGPGIVMNGTRTTS